MANREARRELLAPSFIAMVTALACGGGSHDGDKDPNVPLNPPPATAGSDGVGTGGSGVVSVNPPPPTGSVGGAAVGVNPPPPGGFGAAGGDLVITNPPPPGGDGGVGGAIVVNPPAPCPPTMPAPTSRCTNPIYNQLRCSFSSQACAEILAVCEGEAWTLTCLDGSGGEGGGS